MPAEAEDPDYGLEAEIEGKIDGIIDVIYRLEDLLTGAPATGETITAVIIHNEDFDNPIITDTFVIDADSVTRTYTGITDGDILMAAGARTTTVSIVIHMIGDVELFAGKSVVAEIGGEWDDDAFGTADGVGGEARFNLPYGIAIDSSDETLYVADAMNHRIRKITIATQYVETIIGSERGDAVGSGLDVQLNEPVGVTIDPRGEYLYILENANNKIKRAELSSGTYETEVFVGPETGNTSLGCRDGVGTEARFYKPTALSFHSSTNAFYVTDTSNHRIRKVDVGTAEVTTPYGPLCAGDGEDDEDSGYEDGFGNDALFNKPSQISVFQVPSSDQAYLYISSIMNSAIRRIDLTTDEVKTVIGAPPGTAGDLNGDAIGFGAEARLQWPFGVMVDPTGEFLYIQDSGNTKIKRAKITQTSSSPLDYSYEVSVFVGPDAGTAPIFACNDGKSRYDESITSGEQAYMGFPTTLTISSSGDAMYVTDSMCNTVRKIYLQNVILTVPEL